MGTTSQPYSENPVRRRAWRQAPGGSSQPRSCLGLPRAIWKHICWSDEFHYDPSAQGIGHILREEETRYEPENLAEIPPLDGIVLHGSGLISWFYKSELTFYNDPDDVPAMNNVDSQEINVAPKKMRPPKQRKKETLGGFYKSERFLAWKAAAPHHVDIRPEGNSMTQRFYADIILPKHIQALRESERLSGGFPHLLQEDNDPSHGTKSAINYAQLVRDKSHIQSLSHPGNSLDLSPIEAIWNIIKQRVRKNHRYKTKEELRKRC
ncbi:MAG: hypothetical protein Q9179_007942 [Wetmoreana sp. 5 TL-2023]